MTAMSSLNVAVMTNAASPFLCGETAEYVITADGDVVSISSDCDVDATDWFPAGSSAFAVIVYVASLIADGVMDHVPPETTTVPILAALAAPIALYNVMVSPVTPVPLIVGVVFVGLVIVFMVGADGDVLSTVKVAPLVGTAVTELPATSSPVDNVIVPTPSFAGIA